MSWRAAAGSWPLTELMSRRSWPPGPARLTPDDETTPTVNEASKPRIVRALNMSQTCRLPQCEQSRVNPLGTIADLIHVHAHVVHERQMEVSQALALER